jgi:hypothetical protein
MNSAILNAQNRVAGIPITAVTFSIVGNSSSPYTGSAQSVNVVSVSPAGATYTTSTTTATNTGQVATTTITGTGLYTGSFTSPTLTIIKGTPSVGVSTQGFPDDNQGFYYISVAVFPAGAQGVGIGYSDSYGGFNGNLTGTYVRVSGYDSVPAPADLYWFSNETANWVATSGYVPLPPLG